ncbi:inovirus-type Gp2 protein [Citrobacter werkmanii]|uniref:inovirus-type Gp2 protein n=1 Tax=Citrobacter werkmanii TaxID=67827 RepID=UPI002655541B|nr:inovirus-type Gp2 protein [Citrobacter werkmanii]MDN8559128.1 inovirus-type Gp2 protein [Citrobacter werkmanii]
MSYTPDPYLLALFSAHAEDLQQSYSRLKPFRMDFFFKANSELYWQRRDDWSCYEMHRLAEYAMQALDGLVGYTWVQEFTPRHGIHFHAVFYLNAQRIRMPNQFVYALTDWWQYFTRGQGWDHDCSTRQSYHVFDGQRVVQYDAPEQLKQLKRVLGYLAKTEQKDYRCYSFGLSDIPQPDGRGRPRKRH